MNTKRFTISITAGIAVVLLLIGGTGTNTILFDTAHAQTVTLGEPYFVEKGKSTVQKEISPNITHYTFTANGTMNGNIEVTDTGEFLSISKGDNLIIEPGQGVIATKDGSETAIYTSIDVGNSTNYQGASVYSTNSTGKLSFLNNIMGIYKGEADENGNFVLKEWHWKQQHDISPVLNFSNIALPNIRQLETGIAEPQMETGIIEGSRRIYSPNLSGGK